MRTSRFVTAFGTLFLMIGCSNEKTDDDSTDDDVVDDDVVDDDTTDDGDDDDTPPEYYLFAGFRANRANLDPFPDPQYWVDAAARVSADLPEARCSGILVVGNADADSKCTLSFPSPGAEYGDVIFSPVDLNEEYLEIFDEQGIHIWLMIEPGKADVPTLLQLTLLQYEDHSSVVGVGIDVERYRWIYDPDGLGQAVADENAVDWVALVRAFNSHYTMILEHWLPEKMPTTARDGLIFINKGLGYTSLETMTADFTTWGDHFYPAPVGFHAGYPTDEPWWSALENPPGDIAAALLPTIPNTTGLFWVDSTIDELVPLSANTIAQE